MSRPLRYLLGALLLASITPALAQVFDVTTFLGYKGAPRAVTELQPDGADISISFAPDGHFAVRMYASNRSVEVSTYVWDRVARVITQTTRTIKQTGEEVHHSYYGFDEQGREAYDRYEDYTLVYDYSDDGKELTVWSYPTDPSEDGVRINYIATLDDQGRTVNTRYPVLRLDEWGRDYSEDGLTSTNYHYGARNTKKPFLLYEYEVDEFGNWTKQTVYNWDEDLGQYESEGRVTTREITYF